MPERSDQNADPHTDLGAAVERLAGRLRALPQRRLQAGAAAIGLELARWLDREAQSLEFPGREPYAMPDDGVFVVGDQLALAGRELIAVARLPEHRDLLAEARERVARAARAVD
ncbi:hypothetical protein OG900_25945 [Streptomyces sp. NBC_00433]